MPAMLARNTLSVRASSQAAPKATKPAVKAPKPAFTQAAAAAFAAISLVAASSPAFAAVDVGGTDKERTHPLWMWRASLQHAAALYMQRGTAFIMLSRRVEMGALVLP